MERTLYISSDIQVSGIGHKTIKESQEAEAPERETRVIHCYTYLPHSTILLKTQAKAFPAKDLTQGFNRVVFNTIWLSARLYNLLHF